MRTLVQHARFHVYDDVLPESDFAAVWNFVQLESYVPVHQDVWQKAWRISDGIPLRSQTAVLCREGEASRAGTSAADARRPPRSYPTHTAVDKLLDVVQAGVDGLIGLVGRRGIDYDAISACSYLYPQGTGLSWHADTPRLYTGAYVFFAHPAWNCQWGGELFLADDSEGLELGAGTVIALRRDGTQLRPTAVQLTAFLDNSRENADLGRMGMGQYVAPNPNRLVVIAGGNAHMINRVSPAAGDHVRCSISGFFHRPQS